MAIKTYKPTTPSLRNMVTVIDETITRSSSEKSLTKGTSLIIKLLKHE